MTDKQTAIAQLAIASGVSLEDCEIVVNTVCGTEAKNVNLDGIIEAMRSLVQCSQKAGKAMENLGITLSRYGLSEEMANQSKSQPQPTDGAYSFPRQTEEPEQCQHCRSLGCQL